MKALTRGRADARAGAAVLAAALAVACGQAGWKDAYTRLAAADSAARALGYQPIAGPKSTFGVFRKPGSVRWRVHLEAHHTYFLAAACTAACDTLDFDVAEPHGANLAHDTTAGPTPRLELTAPEEGDYVVAFRWGSCHREDRCRWVAQTYEKAGRTQ